ncbi:MAG: hypothetical protein FWF96_04920 [Kiritimatiellaeota bacterium]|nr:hypothetical protein [Kiritimatiellota bacterium]
MPNLWKWLMQANAKNAFILSVAILAASACGSAWLFANASADDAPPALGAPSNTPPPAFDIPVSVGLADFVNRHLNSEFTIPVNPFMPSLAVENIQRFLDNRRNSDAGPNRWPPDRNTGTTSNNTSNNKTGTGVTNVQPAPPPKPPPVTLTYQGFMTRADGLARAKIHDSSSNTTNFHSENDTLGGATLVSVQHKTLVLRLPDDTEKTLGLHESITFEK